MPFVERNSSGKIIAARLTRSESAPEWVAPSDPGLAALTGKRMPEDTRASLEYTDQGLIRVLEDLIDTLLAKDVIRFTDLPLPAQNRLLQRRSLRSSLNGNADLLDDDGGLL
ncbi:hypothetical protein [Thauera linaloolentis]|uniref:Tryptophan synthase subunit beta like protein n=1 Tax=Thauera linaloolentis (strain DSM 12138 / JCM 21573 / CCUG 41526 / CIP 105981 / IAM 15112 / NBRC 102519 / 47Lol) TaxID=1123367 RepID=N6ZEY7_THAL4|nr:hypothetical protein [Thauera linaloolentis]ENO90719.1 hypothetical protein C666_00795 [Thauera linaloolentis 47Lol = DSM 12138]MCM8565627.1 hypothetical protein [Thauera linaloolentis]